jgi:hypothetical protein
MGDPRVQGNKMIIGIPGRVQILICLRNSAIRYLLLSIGLRIRKEVCNTQNKDKYLIPEKISL